LPQKKAKIEFDTCRGYRPKNGSYYRFSKENPSSFGSPAAKTECGARFLNFFVVFGDYPTKKARTLGKTSSVPGLSTEKWLLLSFFEGKSQFFELACHQSRVWSLIFEFFGCVQ
jgi:hypothetical protein